MQQEVDGKGDFMLSQLPNGYYKRDYFMKDPSSRRLISLSGSECFPQELSTFKFRNSL